MRNHHRTPPAQRFLAKVTKSDQCWLWTGYVINSGYGLFHTGGENGRTVTTHRYSYELHVGPIPRGVWVLHRCDVKRCVRPDHLFLGTRRDNMDDYMAKGLYAPRFHHSGPSHHASVLSTEEALEITTLHQSGHAIRALARQFHVSQRTVQRIVRKDHWALR